MKPSTITLRTFPQGEKEDNIEQFYVEGVRTEQSTGSHTGSGAGNKIHRLMRVLFPTYSLIIGNNSGGFLDAETEQGMLYRNTVSAPKAIDILTTIKHSSASIE